MRDDFSAVNLLLYKGLSARRKCQPTCKVGWPIPLSTVASRVKWILSFVCLDLFVSLNCGCKQERSQNHASPFCSCFIQQYSWSTTSIEAWALRLVKPPWPSGFSQDGLIDASGPSCLRWTWLPARARRGEQEQASLSGPKSTEIAQLGLLLWYA